MTILTKEQWEASVAETWSASIKATYQHLIDEAVKAEREACAKVCNGIAIEARTLWKARYEPHNDGRSDGAFECVEAIRARGQA
jgi:hypothetical protein